MLSLSNGRVSYDNFSPRGIDVGVKVTFSCNSGYFRFGPSEITCQGPGKWNPQPPMCNQSNQLNYIILQTGRFLFQLVSPFYIQLNGQVLQ